MVWPRPDRVREGQGLAKSLEMQKIFPDLAVEMLEVGESTGALPAMLTSVAEFYEEDVQTALGAAHGADRAGDFDFHGDFCRRCVDFAVYADFHVGSNFH